MPAAPGEEAGGRGAGIEGRAAARLAAVQALFQLDFTAAEPARVVAEFEAHRLGQAPEGERLAPADRPWFCRIVEGAWSERASLDALIAPRLGSGWSLEKLDGVIRAVLRAAAYELAHPGAPARAVVSQYVDVAQAFHGERETAFVNALLDALARSLRAGEFDK